MGYGCGGSMDIGWILLKTVMFVLATFVFSVVFWATKNWLEQKPGKKKRR